MRAASGSTPSRLNQRRPNSLDQYIPEIRFVDPKSKAMIPAEIVLSSSPMRWSWTIARQQREPEVEMDVVESDKDSGSGWKVDSFPIGLPLDLRKIVYLLRALRKKRNFGTWISYVDEPFE